MPETHLFCPECHTDLTAENCDPYKHAVACFHVPDVGAENLRRRFSRDDSLYAERLLALLALAKRGVE